MKSTLEIVKEVLDNEGGKITAFVDNVNGCVIIGCASKDVDRLVEIEEWLRLSNKVILFKENTIDITYIAVNERMNDVMNCIGKYL